MIGWATLPSGLAGVVVVGCGAWLGFGPGGRAAGGGLRPACLAVDSGGPARRLKRCRVLCAAL